MILKMNFNFNFKDIPAAPKRQSAALQPRLIRITLSEYRVEMLLAAGKQIALAGRMLLCICNESL